VGESGIFTPTYRPHSMTESQIDHVLENQSNPPTRVHNFAFPGVTVEEDLSSQPSRFQNSSRDLAFKGENTVYCRSLHV